MNRRWGVVSTLVLCAGLSQAANLQGGLSAFAGAYQGTTLFKETSPPDQELAGSGTAFGIFTGLESRLAGRLSLAHILDVDGDSLPAQTQVKFRSDGTFAYVLLTGAEPISGTGRFRTGSHGRVIRYTGTAASSVTSYRLSGRVLRLGSRILVQETLSFEGGSLILSTRLKPLTFPVSRTMRGRSGRGGAGRS